MISDLLLIRRSFHERVIGPADHFVQGFAGRDHWVDGVLLFYKEVDEEGSIVRTGGFDGRFELAAGADGYAGDAVSVGELDEVGADEWRGFVVALVEKFLPLTDHAEVAVVDDGDVD